MKNKICEPNYKKIYLDIISKKYPEKVTLYEWVLSKNKLSFLDIIKLNKKIFTNGVTSQNGKYRAYNEITILHILEFQKKNRLNNFQLARHFQLSRNTVIKWKKFFNR